MLDLTWMDKRKVLSREFSWLRVALSIELDGLRLRLRVGLAQDIPPGSRCALSLRADWHPQLIDDSALGISSSVLLVPAA